MSIKSIAAKLFAQKYTRKPNFGPIILLQRKKSFTKINQREQSKRNLESTIIDQIKNEKDFANQVPVRDYEALKPYVDKVVQGQENILWKENRSILLRHLEQLGANTFR
jgi:hypothetical protein